MKKERMMNEKELRSILVAVAASERGMMIMEDMMEQGREINDVLLTKMIAAFRRLNDCTVEFCIADLEKMGLNSEDVLNETVETVNAEQQKTEDTLLAEKKGLLN